MFDITDIKTREIRREEIVRLIMDVNIKSDFRIQISELIVFLQKWAGCEAIGIRLREGDDYPYFETRGFPDSFVHKESRLCKYGLDGKPEFECICGNILYGKIDPNIPHFTPKGSYWSNNTSDLLFNAKYTDYQTNNIIRCNKAGYESVALIPLRSGDQVFGLLQFNDRLTDRFTPVIIDEFERMADFLAIALLQRKTQEDLKKIEQRLAATLECIGDAVIATNKAGRIIFMNSVAEDLTGWERHEAKHNSLNDIFKISNGRIESENPVEIERVVSRKSHNILINKDGRKIPVEGSRVPIKNKKGKTTGIVITFRDITERKNAEEELITSREKADENVRSKSAFLANMSHEIRTPMNGILGFAELLKDPNISSEERLEYISIIEKSGERMLSIINDIINISKVESGQMQVPITETNVNEQLDFIYNFFKPEAEQKGINLLYKTPLSAKDSSIKTDREKLYAILTNLVKNAIKYTHQGFIDFGYERKGNCLEFYVRDTGNGIPQEKTGLIFERFRQVSESHNGNHEGSGLGLSISKAYVEMLGGKIWVESQIGEGSTSYFTLPYDSGILENNVKDLSINITSTDLAENQTKKLKILIADDDDVSALFLTKVLGRCSREILKARTGVEVVEICQKNPDIDLILMDIQMPEMDGYQATEQIRRFDKDVIIIAQTAYALYSDSGKGYTSRL